MHFFLLRIIQLRSYKNERRKFNLKMLDCHNLLKITKLISY
jgi:hypothetical protein